MWRIVSGTKIASIANSTLPVADVDASLLERVVVGDWAGDGQERQDACEDGKVGEMHFI